MQIGDDQRDLLEDIRKADEDAAMELLKARQELEEMNARDLAEANAEIAGAIAYLISGSQYGDQYTSELQGIEIEVARLKAAAQFLPEAERKRQLEQIEAYKQTQVAQINQQFLAQPLVTPDPVSSTARGGASTVQGRTVIVNISIGGSVVSQTELSDAIYDAIRTGEEAGLLQ